MRKPAVRFDAGDPGRCATCGDPLAWVGNPGSDRIHAWSGRLGLPERPYNHDALSMVSAATEVADRSTDPQRAA
ncbi:hypothetical protein [Salinispora arenicola]|uniref:hypothetical protein n=1 Tax=Salinispora arenicola TaxID=168697 RepID=UPI0003A0008F|nr:hypothetical protein [Salinispora arenicola]